MESWEKKPPKKILTQRQAQAKAEAYCAFQERSQQEVRDKLFGWGVRGNEVEEIIAELIANDYLNEERFALAYASGKFRMKGWGKIKIRQGLLLKSVSEPLIKAALAAIDPMEYQDKLRDTLAKKAAVTNEKDPYIRKHKLTRHAASRGFEQNLIFETLSNNDL